MILLKIIDIILFCCLSLMVLYILILGIASFFKPSRKLKESSRLNKFIILFPAYGEDQVIVNSVSSFLKQDYPEDLFDVIVISDHMKEETNNNLRKLPIDLLIATYADSSKAKALNLAADYLKDKTYDILVVMDADNVTDDDFLVQINNAYEAGDRAIQAHRIAKNTNTSVAVLDAVSEEINNAIFRAGHVNLGLSSSLIGSGMAFDYQWFMANVGFLQTAGEDRELEMLLLKSKIHVSYLQDTYVYDEKTQNLEGFKNQRKRWQAMQFTSLGRSIIDFPKALFQGNFDYCNKILHWMILPRSVMLLLLPLISLVVSFINIYVSIKWWVITWIFYAIIIAVIPSYLCNKKLLKALAKVPVMAFLMCLNFLKLREGKKFIHTEHGI